MAVKGGRGAEGHFVCLINICKYQQWGNQLLHWVNRAKIGWLVHMWIVLRGGMGWMRRERPKDSSMIAEQMEQNGRANIAVKMEQDHIGRNQWRSSHRFLYPSSLLPWHMISHILWGILEKTWAREVLLPDCDGVAWTHQFKMRQSWIREMRFVKR